MEGVSYGARQDQRGVFPLKAMTLGKKIIVSGGGSRSRFGARL
jgi:hypothetical protein